MTKRKPITKTKPLEKTKSLAQKLISSDDTKRGGRKFLNAIWAIFFGILISMIFISAIGKDPINAFSQLIKGGNDLKKITWTYFSMYAFGGLAVAIGFKAGLFNIGVPGQMMASGTAAYFIIRQYGSTDTGSMIVALLVAIATGMIIALLVGLLKSFLNIHEVVTTIMLNWIIFYLAKYIFRPGTKYNFQDYEQSTPFAGIKSSIFNVQDNAWIFSILIVVVVSITLWIIISRTTIGYKIRGIGINKDAATYSGFSKRTLISGTMALSGALAGVSGFMFYIVQRSGSIDFSSGQPLSYGFDAIAIALLAYNSMLGVPLTAILYSYLQAGQSRLELETGIGREFYAIIVGIIVYLAAIAVIFEKFKPAEFSLRRLLYFIFPSYRQKSKKIYQKFKAERNGIQSDIISSKDFYKKNKSQLRKDRRRIKKEIRAVQSQVISQNGDYTSSKKYYNQISDLKIQLLGTEDTYGKSAFKTNKTHLSTIRKKYYKMFVSLTDDYSEILKHRTKKLFTRKGGK